MKIYQVVHVYEVDGGFGDAVYTESVVETFASKKDAEVFVEHFENPHVYDRPYHDLHCGKLEIREINVITDFNLKSYNLKYDWWRKDLVEITLYNTLREVSVKANLTSTLREVCEENGILPEGVIIINGCHAYGAFSDTLARFSIKTGDSVGIVK